MAVSSSLLWLPECCCSWFVTCQMSWVTVSLQAATSTKASGRTDAANGFAWQASSASLAGFKLTRTGIVSNGICKYSHHSAGDFVTMLWASEGSTSTFTCWELTLTLSCTSTHIRLLHVSLSPCRSRPATLRWQLKPLGVGSWCWGCRPTQRWLRH